MKKGELLNLEHLLAFKAVAEHGSITKASQSMGVSKSQVSRDLSELEKRLGSPLVYRTTRKVELTDAGRLLLERSSPLLDGLFDLTHELSSASEAISGQIRLTAPFDIGAMLLPELVDEFVRLFPKVSFEILLSQDFSDLVGRSIDMALRAGNVGTNSFKVRRVGEIRMELVASPQYLSTRQLGTPEEIAAEPCLIFSHLHDQYHVLKSEAGSELELRSRHDIVCNDPQFMLRLALAGKGMALLPNLLCQAALDSGALMRLLPHWTSLGAPLNIVFPSQKRIPRHVRAFGDFLVKRVKLR